MLALEELTVCQGRKGMHTNIVIQLKCKYFRKEVKD